MLVRFLFLVLATSFLTGLAGASAQANDQIKQQGESIVDRIEGAKPASPNYCHMLAQRQAEANPTRPVGHKFKFHSAPLKVLSVKATQSMRDPDSGPSAFRVSLETLVFDEVALRNGILDFVETVSVPDPICRLQ